MILVSPINIVNQNVSVMIEAIRCITYVVFRFEWFSEMETIEQVSTNTNSSKGPKHLFTYQEHKTKGLSTYVTMKKSMSLLMVKNVNNRYDVTSSLIYYNGT